MPRENRKRGKKHKKEQPVHDEPEPKPEAAGPSWILPSTSQQQQQEVNAEAPFGYVDADVKAYFRTVDLQIRDWQDHAPVVQEDTEIDPNEGQLGFLHPLKFRAFTNLLFRSTSISRCGFERNV
jgi:nucleolar protein 9